MKAYVTLTDDFNNTKGTYQLQPVDIHEGCIVTEYKFQFSYRKLNDEYLSYIGKREPEKTSKGNVKLNNSEWVDLLSDQFNVSRNSAKNMLHFMMIIKKRDNFNKQFCGSRRSIHDDD